MGIAAAKPILHGRGLHCRTPFDASGPLCEVRLKKGEVSIGLIGAVLTLGTPQDVTLQELRVEMFMPADEGSEALLVKLGR